MFIYIYVCVCAKILIIGVLVLAFYFGTYKKSILVALRKFLMAALVTSVDDQPAALTSWWLLG